MIQKPIISLFTIVLIVLTFKNCKKGEDDPSVSLRSRTARVAGEWKISAKNMKTSTTTIDFLGTTTTGTNSEVLNGTTLTVESVNNGNTSTRVTEYTLNYTFDKEGAYTLKSNEIETEKDTVEIYNPQSGNDEDYLKITVTAVSTEESGTWNFLSGVGAAENKESINLSQKEIKVKTVVDITYTAITPGAPAKSSVTDTVSSSSTCSMCNQVWKITQLKNKEMVIQGEINNSDSNISSSFSTSTETKGTISMTLTQ